MSEQTIDIDTKQAVPALTIKDDRHLCDIVYQIASKQLVINAAEAEQQAKLEAAKKAFADATGPLSGEIKTLFSAVTAYATANKERLFPGKGKKQKKTFKVLNHELKFRSSSEVVAPANAVAILKNAILNSEVNIMNLGECEASTQIASMIAQLERLIRQPDPELNKDAVKAITDEEVKDFLASLGITIESRDGFKLVFSFTPEAEVAP